MTAFLLGLLAFLVADACLCFWAAWRAPYGYQDETGFHFSPEQKTSVEELSPESSQEEVGARLARCAKA